tara:strand:+ start:2927 stop:4732 length:1806 start_codon:yes stop_codon:yes gene_type:complete
MASLTNKIIANIKQSTNNIENFYNSENVVCIDSSNIRIGIKTKNPEYAIDVSGNDNDSIINSKNLRITNSGTINNLNTVSAVITDVSTHNLDISNLCIFKTISGENAIINNLTTASLDINLVDAPDISCLNLKTQNISGIVLDISDISVNKIVTKKLDFTGDFNINNIIVNNTITSNIITNNYLESTHIYATDISSHNLKVYDYTNLNNVDISKLNVAGDALFNIIDICGTGNFNDISINGVANITTLNANSLDVINLTANGKTVVSSGDFNLESGIFNSLNVSLRANIGNDPRFDSLNVTGNLYMQNGNLRFAGASKFILPRFESVNYTGDVSDGTLTFDQTTGIIKVRTTINKNTADEQSIWNDLDSRKIVATFQLDDSISGNKIIINPDYIIDSGPRKNKFMIENSNNLIIDVYGGNDNVKYKFIPLKPNKYKSLDNSGNDLNIAPDLITYDSSSILIGKIYNNDSGLGYLSSNFSINYEITANLTVRYLNKNPNDVEVNQYTFGIYPSVKASTSDQAITLNYNEEIINNKFIDVNNTVIVFDNSYNFSNISLTYIGTLGNSANNPVKFNNGFKFFISSTKDMNYLVIDSFYCTIKQI